MDLDCKKVLLTLTDGKKPKSAKKYEFSHITKYKAEGFMLYTDDARQSLTMEVKDHQLILQLYLD